MRDSSLEQAVEPCCAAMSLCRAMLYQARPCQTAQPCPATRRALDTPRSPSPQARILHARGRGEKGDEEGVGEREKKEKETTINIDKQRDSLQPSH